MKTKLSSYLTAGLAALVTEELQLSTVAREDDPLDNYRQNLSKIGWGGASSGTDFGAIGTEMMDKMAKRRLVALLLLMMLVGTGVGVYYWVFKTPPPPPPKPLKPAIKKK